MLEISLAAIVVLLMLLRQGDSACRRFLVRTGATSATERCAPNVPAEAERVGKAMTPGTAEDDRVLPKTKNPYFLENYFAIFRNPPTPNASKLMKSRIFFTIFGKLLKF